LEISEGLREASAAKFLERLAVQQARPENVMGKFGEVLPTLSGSYARADYAAHAGAHDGGRTNTHFAESFENSDMSNASDTAAT
jgi:hypothetical protein